MRASAVAAAALCVIAASAISVSALQWTSATTDGGGNNLFYPGVSVTFNFLPGVDLRFDTTGVVGSNIQIQVQIGTNWSPKMSPDQVTNYFDGLLSPSSSTGNAVTVMASQKSPMGPPIRVCTITSRSYMPYTYQTLVVSGTLGSRTRFDCGIYQDGPRFVQAQFATGRGAWYTASLWAAPAPGSGVAEVWVPLPATANRLTDYSVGQQVFVNVTVADSNNGVFAQPVNYHGTPTTSTPYFALAPFLYKLTVVNNHGLQGALTQGSTLQMTGAGLDPTSTFACAWKNAENSVEVASKPTSPSSPTAFACPFPDGLAVMSSANDEIVLLNITAVSAKKGAPGWIPLASGTGQLPSFTYRVVSKVGPALCIGP